MSRTLIIGDVHGCRNELEELVVRFGFVAGRDRLFQTGDMITRGPFSREAVMLAQELGIRCVQGNQEARLLRVLAMPRWLRSARDQAFLDRLGPDADYIARQVRDWPLWIEEENFFVVHGGFQPGYTHPEQMDSKVLLHVRTWDGKGCDMENPENPPWFECDVWQKEIVFGHWAARGLVLLPGLRGIDTGCVSGGYLTGWCPEENRIYQVEAHRPYAVKSNCRPIPLEVAK